MFLAGLKIERMGKYGPTQRAEDPLVAVVKVGNDFGDQTIRLTDECARRVLAIIAEELVAAVRQTAQIVAGDILTALPAPQSAEA